MLIKFYRNFANILENVEIFWIVLAKIPDFWKNSDRTPIWIVRLVRSLADRTFQPRYAPPPRGAGGYAPPPRGAPPPRYQQRPHRTGTNYYWGPPVPQFLSTALVLFVSGRYFQWLKHQFPRRIDRLRPRRRFSDSCAYDLKRYTYFLFKISRIGACERNTKRYFRYVSERWHWISRR